MTIGEIVWLIRIKRAYYATPFWSLLLKLMHDQHLRAGPQVPPGAKLRLLLPPLAA